MDADCENTLQDQHFGIGVCCESIERWHVQKAVSESVSQWEGRKCESCCLKWEV